MIWPATANKIPGFTCQLARSELTTRGGGVRVQVKTPRSCVRPFRLVCCNCRRRSSCILFVGGQAAPPAFWGQGQHRRGQGPGTDSVRHVPLSVGNPRREAAAAPLKLCPASVAGPLLWYVCILYVLMSDGGKRAHSTCKVMQTSCLADTLLSGRCRRRPVPLGPERCRRQRLTQPISPASSSAAPLREYIHR